MPIEQELERAEQLKALRRSFPSSQPKIKKAKQASLLAYIDPFLDWLFGIALAMAILKDILDLIGVGSLPGIGTVVTLIVSGTIGFIMLITGSSGKRGVARSFLKRYGTLVAGTFVELLFGVDFFPIETAMVIIIYVMTLKERRKSSLE